MNEIVVQIIVAAAGIASAAIIAQRGWWRIDGPDGVTARPDLVARMRPLAFVAGVLVIFSAQGLGAGLPALLGYGAARAASGGVLADGGVAMGVHKPGIDDLGRVALGAYGLGLIAAVCVLVALAYLSKLTSPSSLRAGERRDAVRATPMAAGLTLTRGSWRSTTLQALGVLVLVLPLCALVGVVMTHVARVTTGLPEDGVAHETLRALREAWNAGAPGADPGTGAGIGGDAGAGTAASSHTFGSLWPLAAVAFGAIIGAPIVEEVLFRVCVQSGLLALLHGRLRSAADEEGTAVRLASWASILLTSGVFVAMHTGGSSASWHALPTLFVLSVALGVAYERTRRVGVVILAHAGFNAVNVGLALAAG